MAQQHMKGHSMTQKVLDSLFSKHNTQHYQPIKFTTLVYIKCGGKLDLNACNKPSMAKCPTRAYLTVMPKTFFKINFC